MTSVIFLGAILVVVAFLSVTRKDATESLVAARRRAQVLVVAHRTAATPALLGGDPAARRTEPGALPPARPEPGARMRS